MGTTPNGNREDAFLNTVRSFPSSEVQAATREAESAARRSVEKATGKPMLRQPSKKDRKAAPHVYWTAKNLLIQTRMSTQKDVPKDLKSMVNFLRSGSAWVMVYALKANSEFLDPQRRYVELSILFEVATLMLCCTRVLRELRVLKIKCKGGGEEKEEYVDNGCAVSQLAGNMRAEIRGWRDATEKRLREEGLSVPDVSTKLFSFDMLYKSFVL